MDRAQSDIGYVLILSVATVSFVCVDGLGFCYVYFYLFYLVCRGWCIVVVVVVVELGKKLGCLALLVYLSL